MPQDIRSFFKPISKKSDSSSSSVNSNSKEKNEKKSSPKEAEKHNSKSNKTFSNNSKSSVDKIKSVAKETSSLHLSDESKNNKNSNQSTKNLLKKNDKKILQISDSDEENDVIQETPNKTDKSKFSQLLKKRKAHFISSDSEEDEKKSSKYFKKDSEKLNPVSVADLLKGNVHQSKEKVKQESVESQNNVKKSRKKKTEVGVHTDKKFEKTLMDLDNDDDIFLQNEDLLNQTIESATKSCDKQSDDESKKELEKNNETSNTKDKSPKNTDKTPKKQKPMDAKKTPKSDRKKRTHQNEDNETPNKKVKLEHSDSGIDPGQEAHERKRYSAVLYQKYLHRGGPKHLGSKELPEGNPDCLKNLTFLRTGVLDSLDSENFDEIIKKHGGRVVHAVSKKVNYLVVGEEPGPAKLAKAEDYKIPNITEDELLDMILVKSGKEKKYTVQKILSEDGGIETDSSPKSFKSEDIETLRSPVKSKNATKKSPQKQKQTPEKRNFITSESQNLVKESTKIDIEKKNLNTNVCDMSFVDKYKPSDVKQIIGQQTSNSNMNRLREWLESWNVNEKRRIKKEVQMPKPWDKCNKGDYYKCALLSGPPGVGKTTTATLVARSLGFDVVEFNASDTRSKKLLQEEVMNILNSNTLTAYNQSSNFSKDLLKKRVLLMDEVDGMAGNEDRGGIQELISLIKTSKIPIICMCNDRYHNKIKSLANYCFDLRFEKPKPQQILGLIMSISCKEGIKIDPKIAMEVIKGTDCDIRQTLNQLTMIASCETDLTFEKAQKESSLIKKDTVFGPWQVCRKVFSESDQKEMSLIDKARLFFYDYSIGPLFIQENYLKVTPKVKGKKDIMKKVALAAEAISFGAAIDQKIRETNSWSLLDVEAMFASVIPGHHMSGSVPVNIDFPSWLGKTSKRSKLKRITTELATHTNLHTSGGSLAMVLDYSKPLFNNIVLPLKTQGLNGVPTAINTMKLYQLLREDLEGLAELSTWLKQKSLWESVEGKVKAAFTRNYNKEVPMYAHSATTNVSKKTSVLASGEDVYGELEDNDDNQEEDNDKIENDKLIKAKVRSKKTNETSKTSKASSSKKATTSKRKNGK